MTKFEEGIGRFEGRIEPVFDPSPEPANWETAEPPAADPTVPPIWEVSLYGDLDEPHKKLRTRRFLIAFDEETVTSSGTIPEQWPHVDLQSEDIERINRLAVERGMDASTAIWAIYSAGDDIELDALSAPQRKALLRERQKHSIS